MQFLYFTKHWPAESIETLIGIAKKVDADGLDLAVRAGQAVNPENVKNALPDAVKKCQDNGISVGMVTMETKPTDPEDPTVEAVLAACGQGGVQLLKVGYFTHEPGRDYWKEIDRLRGVLEQLGKMAARHGVVACYHTHSGMFFGSNASGLMHLLRGQDPASLGAYIDVGHLALNGEPIPLALDIVRDYLRMVGVKSPMWESRREGERAVWNYRIVPMFEGIVDCEQMFRELGRIGFDGPLTFHTEYEMPQDQLVEALAKEIAYCRRALKNL